MTIETLQAQQIFSRLMIEAIDLRRLHSVPCGAQALFGEPMANGGGTKYVPDSEVIEFDVRKGNRGISTFVHRGLLAKPLNKPAHVSGNFTSIARTFPLLHDTGLVTAAQLLKRVFGEPPGAPLTQFERARRNARTVFEDIVIDHLYAQEYSAWQMIKTGKMDLIYGTSSNDEKIDTKRDTDHTFKCSASWATAGTDLLGDIDTAGTLLIEDASVPLDVMVVGANIPGYIAKNTAVQTYANLVAAGTTGFALIYFGANNKPEARFNHMIANGFIPICKITTEKGRTVNVFRYEGGYVDSGGTFHYYVGDKEAIFFSSTAACDRYFGPPEKLPPTRQQVADWDEIFGFSPENIDLPPNIAATPRVIDPVEFSCDVRRNPDNTAFELTVQAAPMFVTRDTDYFAYIADVTAP
jgi:hypothetical protein